jgi:hypothetical protein
LTQPTFTLDLVRSLRGSPLTCLVAILLLEQSGQVPVTELLLKDATGYGDHTLTDSLRALTSPSRQIVVRVPGGWRLAGGFQLPLTLDENRVIRGFEATTTTALMVESKKNLSKAVVVESENRVIRGFENDEQELIHNILHNQGQIGEPMATRLALMEGMTAISAMAHCIKAAFENTETGLLIHRLRMGDGIEEAYRRQAQDRIDKMYF